MRAGAPILFSLLILSVIADPDNFSGRETIHGSIEPFLSFLRRSTDYLENGVIDIDRFSEDVTTKFSEIMTGRSTLQVAALEKVNEAMAIGQLEEAIKVSLKSRLTPILMLSSFSFLKVILLCLKLLQQLRSCRRKLVICSLLI